MAIQTLFLGRQPILDRKQVVVGHELLFRASDCPYANVNDYFQAGAEVIISTLSNFGMREVLGRTKGFINVSEDLLMNDVLELLPPEQVVIELLEFVSTGPHVVERCLDLKRKGFSLALDDNIFAPEFEPLYAIVDIVKVDILEVAPEDLPDMVRKLRKWPVRLLAEKVETEDQFKICQELGFELFQGYYFARPVVLKKKSMNLSDLAQMELLKMVLADADIQEIEDQFKRNPTMSYHLLRVVNSVAMGIREKIKSLRHALVVLGRQQLKRWIQLTIFAGKDPRGMKSPLLEMAAVRGKMMEELLKSVPMHGKGDSPERAFMVGALSLLDVLLEVSMEEIVNELNLSDDIREALLRHEGVLGSLLFVVEKMEVMDFQAVAGLLDELFLTRDQLLAAQVEAIGWTGTLHDTQ